VSYKKRKIGNHFIYPVVGIILVILGAILWLLPVIPGFPLIIIGLPLLFCFHPRIEFLFHRYLKSLGRFLMKKIRKKPRE